MSPRFNVSEYDSLEVTTGDASVIKEDGIPMIGQVLKNGQEPMERCCDDNL